MRLFPVFFLLLFSCGLIAQTDTVFNQTDANNRKQGYWKKYYPNGKLMYKGFFKDDKPTGEMRRYFESGSLKALMKYDLKGENAVAEIFYEDGSLAATGKYAGSQKDSIWTYYSYYNRNVSAIESYLKGKRNGTFISYYNNGDVSEKIEYSNDRKSGSWEQYFRGNVPKLKATYTDNMLNGPFTVYYASGKPYISGIYKNDVREGKWTLYHEDGSVQNTLNYIAGKASEEKDLTREQQDFFKMIDEAQGKFNEPDETDFLSPSGK